MFLAAIEGWETHWEGGPRGEEQKTTGPDRGSGGGLGERLRAMKREGLREQGDAVGARAVTGDWVPGVGLEREMMRAEAQMKLGEAAREGTLDTFFQGLRERGHVGLANEGARVWTCVQEPSEGGSQWYALQRSQSMAKVAGLGGEDEEAARSVKCHNMEPGPSRIRSIQGGAAPDAAGGKGSGHDSGTGVSTRSA